MGNFKTVFQRVPGFMGAWVRLLKGRDKGTVAVTFLMSLPVLLTAIGVLVQYALLVNAKLTVDRAVAAAARSAMTSLPNDPVIDEINGEDNVRRAAVLALEGVSPVSPLVTSEGTQVADALNLMGRPLSNQFAAKYSYAQNATTVTIEPLDSNGVVVRAGADYARLPAPRARVTVKYDFYMNVPVAKFAGRLDSVAGVQGRFIRLMGTVDVQLSPGREVPTDGMGEPTVR